MNINVVALKHQLKQRSSNGGHQGFPIGPIIKINRKQKNLTLEETAEGICSVSYLSKLENNKIKVSDKFIDPLLKRFAINESQIFVNEHFTEDVVKLLKSYLNGFELDENKKYDRYVDASSKVYILFKYVLSKMYKEAYYVFLELEKCLKSLNDMEVLVTLLSVSTILFEYGRYYDALECLELIDLADAPEILLLIIKYKKIILSLKLNRSDYVLRNYHDTLESLWRYRLIDLAKMVQVEYLAFVMANMDRRSPNISTIQSDIERLDFGTGDDIIYLTSILHFLREDYHIAYQNIRDRNLKDERLLMLSLLILDKQKSRAELLRLIDDCKLKLNNINNTFFIKFIKKKYGNNDKEFLSFIRKYVAVPYLEISDWKILEYIMADSIYMFRSHHFYKEAIGLREFHIGLHKKLTSI